jgi:hypothetical protein
MQARSPMAVEISKPQVPFVEAPPDTWSAQREHLMQRRITDLGLTIEGTYLETIVQGLYAELGAAGIKLRPKVYLSNEWSCPDGVPVIGIPFYLADPKLSRIEDEIMDGVEAQSELEISSYLRHEAGHAFNYAHKLFETPEWRALFGEMSLPYLEDYTPRPFSRDFVRHIPGWYAQKHPDEDFSETFAIWLTPDSNWREVYRGWGCYKKLEYVERIVRERGQADPLVTGEDYDFDAEAMVYSVAEHYRQTRPELSPIEGDFDHELRYIFRGEAGDRRQPMAASELLTRYRRQIIGRVAYWTGLYDVQVRSLILHLIERCARLELKLDMTQRDRVLIDFVAFAATLCMNRLYRGKYVFNQEPA